MTNKALTDLVTAWSLASSLINYLYYFSCFPTLLFSKGSGSTPTSAPLHMILLLGFRNPRLGFSVPITLSHNILYFLFVGPITTAIMNYLCNYLLYISHSH